MYWEQMRESNSLLRGYEPGDLAVCPICDILCIYYIKNFLKSQKFFNILEKIFMYLAAADSVVALATAAIRNSPACFLPGTTSWNQTNDLAGMNRSL